ncbi:TIR domain-containing protein [Pectobacterium brasiliense]|uniref:TIR domain-containing protein n=1 Tax=Pectobacterium brasiliense TaxID=180957 RepID=UPI00300E15F8
MSISSNQSSIVRIQKDIASLQQKIAEESKKEARLLTQIQQTQRSITKNTSASTLSSKLTQIARYNEDIAKCNSKKSDISKTIANKTSELHRYETQLAKDEDTERKKQDADRKKKEKEQLDFQKKLTLEMEAKTRAIQAQIKVTSQSLATHSHTSEEDDIQPEYDVFISHASEDKDSFARPFAERLKELGINVWYDEFSLSWGDSLRRKIDQGLGNSRFGIVVISKAFVTKPWTGYEFDGLVTREINGSGRILPIWHEISKAEVLKFSSTLADKKALTTSDFTIDEMAEQLLPLLKK